MIAVPLACEALTLCYDDFLLIRRDVRLYAKIAAKAVDIHIAFSCPSDIRCIADLFLPTLIGIYIYIYIERPDCPLAKIRL